MKILVTALHAKNEFFGKTIQIKLDELHKTHVQVACTVMEHVSIEKKEIDDLLNNTFDYFNWVQNEGMYAGEMVNNICRFNKTHASMSVGDIVKIQYESMALDKHGQYEVVTRYYKVMGMGFMELKEKNTDIPKSFGQRLREVVEQNEKEEKNKKLKFS